MRPLFYVVLIISSTWATAAPTIRSSTLLKDPTLAFRPVSPDAAQALAARLPDGFSGKDYLTDPDAHWRIHAGDLRVDGNFINDDLLIIDGDLAIQGYYSDYDNTGSMIVLGDMRVSDLYSWGTLSVSGTLRGDGVIYADYNDFVFDAGRVEVPALIISDKSGRVGEVHAPIYQSSWESAPAGSTLTMLRTLAPELLAPSLSSVVADGYGVEALSPDPRAFLRRLADGLPSIRRAPGPATLVEDLSVAIANDSDDSQLAPLLGRDRLLATAIAQRTNLSPPLVDALIAQGDPLALAWLARNRHTGASALERLVARQPALLALAIEHPHVSEALLSQALAEEAVDVRLALARRNDILPGQLATLLADAHPKVRTEALYTHAHRLTEAQLTRLASDPEEDVRVALSRSIYAPLSSEILTTLAADPAARVRRAVGARLEAAAFGELWLSVSLQDRRTLAHRLLDDADRGAHFHALAAAAPAAQRDIVQHASDEVRPYLLKSVARATTSRSLQLELAASDDPELLHELARNLALSEAVQLSLIERLPPAERRRFVSMFDTDAFNERNEGIEGVVDALMENPNTASVVMDRATAYCARTMGNATFCHNLIRRDDLSRAQLEQLRKSTLGEVRDKVALAIMNSAMASRKQVLWAIRRWHEEAHILEAANALETLRGAAFWRALAASDLDELRAIAGANAATPPDALEALLAKDGETEIAWNATANPALPAARLSSLVDGPLRFAIINNPTATPALIERVMKAAIQTGDSAEARRCGQWLAAHSLARAQED